jgi:hypothetical protein
MGWVGALIAFAATVAIVMVSNGLPLVGAAGVLQISGQTLTVLAWVVPILAVATGVMITVFFLGKRAANR